MPPRALVIAARTATLSALIPLMPGDRRLGPLVQQYTTDELTQSYLDTVIDQWEEQHGIIQLRNRDPRGFMLEPHTGKKIPLGTAAIDEYLEK